MAVSAAAWSTSAFGWKGDPQICAILLGSRRPEIGGDDSGYSRFSPNCDIRKASTGAQMPLQKRTAKEIAELIVAGYERRGWL